MLARVLNLTLCMIMYWNAALIPWDPLANEVASTPVMGLIDPK